MVNDRTERIAEEISELIRRREVNTEAIVECNNISKDCYNKQNRLLKRMDKLIHSGPLDFTLAKKITDVGHYINSVGGTIHFDNGRLDTCTKDNEDINEEIKELKAELQELGNSEIPTTGNLQ